MFTTITHAFNIHTLHADINKPYITKKTLPILFIIRILVAVDCVNDTNTSIVAIKPNIS